MNREKTGQPGENALSFHNLGHSWQRGGWQRKGGARHEDWLFRHYHGALPRGHIAAILGPNGCGKTTLLRLLLGLGQPQEGEVTVHGRTALVPQLFQAAFDYSVLDMVLMGRAAAVGLLSQPTRRDSEAAMESLDRLGMASLAGATFHHLSGGQRQLVLFARALASAPQILILDEPGSALDLRNQALILERMATLAHKDGLTVLFTTHHPHHALAIADDVFLMTGRESLLSGPAREILSEENLLSLYGVPLRRLTFEHEGRCQETLCPVLSPEVIAARRRVA